MDCSYTLLEMCHCTPNVFGNKSKPCAVSCIFRVMWTACLHWILILLLCCVLALLCCNEPDPHRRDRLAKTLESFLPRSLNSRVIVSAQDGRSFGQCETGTYDKVGWWESYSWKLLGEFLFDIMRWHASFSLPWLEMNERSKPLKKSE